MKAVLIAHSVQSSRTHDLFVLLEEILKISPTANSLRDALAILMPYAVEIRYPDDWFMPTQDDTLEARTAARQVFEWAKHITPELF